jgi:hypothetical protein
MQPELRVAHFAFIVALMLMLPSTGLSYPLGVDCVATSTDKARKSEVAEVDLRLPHGYKVIEIVPGRSVLKVAVPFESKEMAEQRIPALQISHIWDHVLSKHGLRCFDQAVEFYSPSGKEVFFISEEDT